MRMRLVALMAVVGLMWTGCTDKQDKIDDELIQDYIAENNLDATSTNSGLYYVVDNEGTGKRPTSTSFVTVAYTGYLLDGTVFDESNGFTTNLQSVIDGWTEGIPKFKEGGNGKLLIPSHLGYGNVETGDIPKNSVLIFDIELLDVD